MALTKITGEGVGAIDSLTVDTNTLHVDATNNRVGVGTASPNGNGALTVNAATNNSPQIVFTENDTAKWLVGHRHDGDHFRFYDLANSAERLRIQSGGGISFNGDTAAANALDDYEEGTFTPTIASGVSVSSYDIQRGTYTKIGNTVILAAQVEVNGSSRTGSQVLIGGIPFAAVNDGNKPTHGGFITYQNGFSNTVNQLFIGSTGNDLLAFHEIDGSSLIGSELSGASFEVRVVVIYKTS